jgi:X-X-X-Leu-X-X-Gly heptad repeat protein
MSSSGSCRLLHTLSSKAGELSSKANELSSKGDELRPAIPGTGKPVLLGADDQGGRAATLRRLQRIDELPAPKQRAMLKVLDALLEQQR